MPCGRGRQRGAIELRDVGAVLREDALVLATLGPDLGHRDISGRRRSDVGDQPPLLSASLSDSSSSVLSVVW